MSRRCSIVSLQYIGSLSASSGRYSVTGSLTLLMYPSSIAMPHSNDVSVFDIENTLQMDVLSKFPLNASNMIVSLCMISIDPSFFTVSMICFKDMANVVSLKLNIKLTVSKVWVS